LEEFVIPDVRSYLHFLRVKCSTLESKMPNLTFSLHLNTSHSVRVHVPPSVYLKDYMQDYNNYKKEETRCKVMIEANYAHNPKDTV
jgi:hypothetical protein